MAALVVVEDADGFGRVRFVIRDARAGSGARACPPWAAVCASIHGMKGLAVHTIRRALELLEG